MKLKILRANIRGKEGSIIIKQGNKIINNTELEQCRQSLKRDDSDSVLFNFEEIGEEIN